MTSTPVPPGTPLESKNYIDLPRPFKSGKTNRGGSRRSKSLKQILAAERDAALGIEGSGTGKRKGKKTALSALQYGSGTGTAAASSQVSRAGSSEPADADMTMTSVGDVTMENGAQALATATAAAEAAAKRKRDLPSYSSVEAPPSLRPRKKFCDVTGLLAPYTDPKSRLRYHSVEIYEIIKTFGPGVDQAYLSLRGEASQIK